MNSLETRKIPNPTPPADEEKKEDMIRINGFQQVLEMLRFADEDFRESLLNRLAQRDRNLVAALRKQL